LVGPHAAPLIVVLAVACVAGGLSLARDPHDVAGRLPMRASAAAQVPRDWPAWGHSNAGDRYSPLTEISPANVARLQVAWTFRTGDLPGPHDPSETTFELT